MMHAAKAKKQLWQQLYIWTALHTEGLVLACWYPMRVK